ncbi:MAG: gliding motility-associated C-terminal domain-containing protein, partial [Bacteroidota bacterium]
PEFQLGNDLEWCEGSTIDLEAGVFNTEMQVISWTVDGQDISGESVSLEAQLGMDFMVQGTSIHGCEAMLAVPVVVNALPQAVFNTDPQEGCIPLFVNFTNLSQNPEGTDYLWDLSGQIFDAFEPPSFTFDDASSLNMSMTAVSPEGCFQTLSADDVIIVHNDPIADFSLTNNELTDDYPYIEIDNNSLDALTWDWETDLFESTEWSPFVDLGSLTSPNASEICLNVQSEFGCVDSICKNVSWITTPDVFVPNTFTPNQDGVNDQFVPVFNGIDPSTCTLQIFNRWGELIFITDDMQKGWLGESQVGGEYYSQDGVYTWVFQGNDQSTREILQFKGHVQLLR